MAEAQRPRLRCFLAIPYAVKFQKVREAVERGVTDANFRVIALDEQRALGLTVREAVLGDLARSDCVVADVTDRNPDVFFELGLAQAMGKGLFLLSQRSTSESIPSDFVGFNILLYEPTTTGLLNLRKRLTQSLQHYRRSPRSPRLIPGSRFATPFFVDWERLDPSEAENLCLELLAQLGYQQLNWDKESREFDLIAELPRKDPDGFEYRELWLIAMGRNAPAEMLLDMANREPELLLHRLFRDDERFERLIARSEGDVPVTLLAILLRGDSPKLQLDDTRRRSTRRIRGVPYSYSLRVRVWDRNYLTSLVQQFPQLGYKYFSDEGRFRSKFRKTPEELYQENVELTNRQTMLISALEDEKNRRVRAERDAIWKDIAFTAAHKIGNPIFAIETNLDPLQKRIAENRSQEAVEVIGSVRASVEKAKDIVDQFKSLTRAQEISPVSTLLRPILENACDVAQNQGVMCKIECADDIRIHGDPDRLAECFDELTSNSLHWLDKPEKRIAILVTQPAPHLPPQSIDSSKKYTFIQFKDNGPGVALENKTKIFDAFFTTRDHGTGLGLAVVRRIIEGHGGTIVESGRPGEGAEFEIYLPLTAEPVGSASASTPRAVRERSSIEAYRRK